MRSWSLKRFVDEHGLYRASRIWGVSHQAVSKAILNDRAINIVYVEGQYEVHEAKLLSTVAADDLDFTIK